MSLTFTGYLPPSRPDPATRAEAARLAAKLGLPLGAGGIAATGMGYPPWRFGMAANRYLSGRLGGGSDADRSLGGFGAGSETTAWPPRGPGSSAATMAAYMQALDVASRAAAATSRRECRRQ